MKKWYLFCLFPLLTACGVEQIDEGYRGVEINWGKVVGEPLNPGLYFYNPFSSSILELSVREEKMEGQTECFTKDTQNVVIKYALTFYPTPAKIGHLYSQFGRDWESKIVSQAVLGAMKDVVGQYDSSDLVRVREAATKAAQTKIQEALQARDVTVTRLDFTNLDFNDDYEKAVEAKVTAIQNAAAEKNRSVQVDEVAKQTIRTAEAQARAMQIQTAALSQSASLVEYERVKKWDGHVPDVLITGGGATPIIDMSGLVKSRKQ